MWLFGSYYGARHVLGSCRALCSRVSSIVIISLGEEGAGRCVSRAFVCFARVCFCPLFFLFILVSGID